MILNQQSPVPLYHQLGRIILEKIRTGEYGPGEKIPSEHELANEFGVGRPTVRQATDSLVRRRVLERKRGSGTYVCRKEEEIDLFSLAGTMSAFEKKGIKLTRRMVINIRLMLIQGDKENPFTGTQAFYFSRISSVSGNPILIENMYLDPQIFPNLGADDFSAGSLSGIIEERYGMRPTHGKQSFSIRYPDEEQARLLKISESDPLLFVRRYLHFSNILNAVYSELFCKTETFVFTQKIGSIYE
jgi:GntR family transcriptional regulator